ncbi:SDR family oxidoreductase [Streptomyces daliensis]|uniref:SDR family oxidoreductase n=1 Tax=Streptomyces daliensis TaxID=299421 RepID=A0A8T4ILV3_9ACTN|nr:SDR family oxidoreductase [Streptomyces daliensis]
MATPRQVTVVTGGGRGIGAAVAVRLARAGHRVGIGYERARESAERTADAVRAEGGEALTVRLDTSVEEQVDALFDQVTEAFGPLTGLVNNAGISGPLGRFLDVSAEEWDRIFDVNVRGSFLVTRRIAPGMAERGFGRIVHLSSVSAERGGGVFGGVAYSAAKAALLGFSRALARELGPSGVTVNSVAPGLIDTDITAGRLDPERKAAMVADIPMGRTGTVTDVADVIAFLARPESEYLTGVTYDINGGSHIH